MPYIDRGLSLGPRGSQALCEEIRATIRSLTVLSRPTLAISRFMHGLIHFGQRLTGTIGFLQITFLGPTPQLYATSSSTGGWTQRAALRGAGPWTS